VGADAQDAGAQAAAQFDALLTPSVYQAAWRYACYLAPVYEDAQDLLQEALAQALLRLHQLRDGARFKGWLLRVIRTEYLMARRRGARLKGRAPDRAPAGLLVLSPADDPQGGLGRLPSQLAAALIQLPNALREAVELYYLNELSAAEAGQVLGIRSGAVKVRLSRARALLRRALAESAGQLQSSERGE